MFHVLLCAVEVLSVIHKAGWVHRDLSPNNLYLYIDPVSGEKWGLVGDLEYTKKAGTRGRCGIRTGTLDFVATEILMKEYNFTSKKPGFGPGSQTSCCESGYMDIINDALALEGNKRSIFAKPNKQSVWANYLHDLESIFWIAVWTLFNYERASHADSTSEEVNEERCYQRRISAQLFPGITQHERRVAFLLEDELFFEYIGYVSNQLLGLKALVILLRNSLVAFYEKTRVGTNEPLLPADSNPVHIHILELIRGIPRHGIIVRSLQEEPKDTVNESDLKRTTYDSRDDAGQPRKRQSIMTLSSNQSRRITRSITRIITSMAIASASNT